MVLEKKNDEKKSSEKKMEWRSERLILEAYGSSYICIDKTTPDSPRFAPDPVADRTKNISIVGAGPYGLLTAFYLTKTLPDKEQYHIRIFEKLSCKEAFEREYIFSLPSLSSPATKDKNERRASRPRVVDLLRFLSSENILDKNNGNTFLCGTFQRALARYLFGLGIKIKYDTEVNIEDDQIIKTFYKSEVIKTETVFYHTYGLSYVLIVTKENYENYEKVPGNFQLNTLIKTELEDNIRIESIRKYQDPVNLGKNRVEILATGLKQDTVNKLKKTDSENFKIVKLSPDVRNWVETPSIFPLLQKVYESIDVNQKIQKYETNNFD